MSVIGNAKVSIGCPRPREGWTSYQFNLQKFKDLNTTEIAHRRRYSNQGNYVETPEFSCNGHGWNLRIYPGGDDDAPEGYVSIYLTHCSEGSTTADFEIEIIDKFGNNKEASQYTHKFEGVGGYGCGKRDFILRSDILDESQNILDSDGTLTVVVSIKLTDVFVPKNPLLKMVKETFLEETTADVCFEVSSAEAKKGKKKKAKASEFFHAHSFILKKCAPMLVDLFDFDDDNDGKLATVTITDVKPDVFRYMLWYVYGGSVPEEDLATHAKDIIVAADKYSIINLKLEAEAAYVKSANITMQSAMDDLLYADAKNCPLLKEAVMNFLTANHYEAAEKISFTDFPAHVVKDLLIAFGRNSNSKKVASGAATDELSTLCVSALRRKLDEMGSSVDGSREAMIESIRNSS
jgi:speckle-type POZ protein